MEKQDFYKEFIFRSSRSSGSGGQHVNKVETRIELLFDLPNSMLLSAQEKALLHERWSNRLSKEGILRIVCQKTRSQLKNREIVVQKFFQILKKGLEIPKIRKKRKMSLAAKNKRLATKKQHSEKKALRKKVIL